MTPRTQRLPMSDLALALLVHKIGADHPMFNPVHPIVGAAKAIGHAVGDAAHDVKDYLDKPEVDPQVARIIMDAQRQHHPTRRR